MPKYFFHDFYSKNKFLKSKKIFTNNCKERTCKIIDLPKNYIFLDGDEIEKCLSGVLNKSADIIIIPEEADEDNKIDIIVCELCKGTKGIDEVKNKIRNTSEHIVCVVNNFSDFEIGSFKCFYIGGYEKIDLPTLKKKTPTINIEGLNMYNILIDNYPCGVSFNELN